jgi:hypothetical protein
MLKEEGGQPGCVWEIVKKRRGEGDEDGGKGRE